VGHTGALYNVRVRGKPDDYRRLGDIDEHGTALIDCLQRYLAGANLENADRTRAMVCTGVREVGTELEVMLRHGEAGVVSDIEDPAGGVLLHRQYEHRQQRPCAALFRLPPAQDVGWLALHFNAGASTRGLLGQHLDQSLKDETHLRLEITPCIDESVFRQAIDDGAIESISLERWEHPTDAARAEIDEWVRRGEVGKVEVTITAPGRANRLRTALLQRFAEGQAGARERILSFDGVIYERAKVVVDLPGGGQRTFNIDRPEAGHPMLQELDVPSAGIPAYSDLFDELRAMIPAAT
jgi:hypothetical protein